MAIIQRLVFCQAVLCLLMCLFLSGQSSLTAAPCQPGTYYDSIFEATGTPCVLCQRGSYSIAVTSDSSTCTSCPLGYTTSGPGATECIPEVKLCDRPLLLKGVGCSRGQWYHSATQSCEECPQGTFQFFTNQACCWPCLRVKKGSSTEAGGAISPRLCTPLKCPSNVRVVKGCYSLSVSWDPVDYPNVHYTVRVSQSTGTPAFEVQVSCDYAGPVTFPGLQPNTVYNVQVIVHAGVSSVVCPAQVVRTFSVGLDVKVKSGLDCVRFEWNWNYLDVPDVVFKISFLEEYYETTRNTFKAYELTPGTKYNLVIEVCINERIVKRQEVMFNTLTPAIEKTGMKGVLGGIIPSRGKQINVNFPNCVNGTLIVIKKMDAQSFIVNGTSYSASGSEEPRMIFSSHNSGGLKIIGRNDDKSGDFYIHYTCTDLLHMHQLLEMMEDCTVRHCMKNDSFVYDLIALTNGDHSIALWTRLCPFTSLWAVRRPVKCSDCPLNEPPSCPYPYGTESASCPCEFNGPCRVYPRPKQWNCT